MRIREQHQLVFQFLIVALVPLLILWLVDAISLTTFTLAGLGAAALAVLVGFIWAGPTLRASPAPRSESLVPEGLEQDWDLEALNLVAKATELMANPPQLYRWLTQRLAELVEAERCALILRRPDGLGAFQVVAQSSGFGPEDIFELEEYAGQVGAGLAGMRETLILGEQTASERETQLPGEQNVMLAPVVADERMVGYFRFANKRSGFQTVDAEFSGLMVDRLAPVLDNVRLHLDIQRRLEEMSLLYEVGVPLAGALDFDETVSQAVRAIQSGLGCEQVNLLLVDESSETLFLHEASPYRASSGREVRVPLGVGLIGRVAETGELANVPDMTGQQDEFSLAQDTRSELCIPLTLGSWIIGVIDAQSTRPNAFDDSDVRLLQIVAGQLAAALQSARLYEATRQRATELFQLYDATLAISTAEVDRSEVAELVMKRLIEATGVDGGRLSYWDRSTGVLMTRLVQGPTLAGHSEVEDFLKTYLLTSRMPLPLYLDDQATDSDVAHAMDVEGIRSALILPLVAHNRVIGVVDLTLASARTQFDQEKVRLAMTLANQAAVALENARLYQETKRAVEELAALQALALDITAQIALPELMDRLMHRARHLVNATGSAIYLLAPEESELKPAATDVPWSGTVIQDGLELARQVMVDVRPLQQRIRSSTATVGEEEEITLSCACVPLRWREQAVGVISVFRPENEGPFASQELYLLELLAPQAAIAILNVQLYEALEMRMQELEQAQSSLIQAEKAAAIGRLAASLAHEINNPLQSLNNCLHLSLHPDLPSEKRAVYLSMAREEVERLFGIVNRMLNFYRPATGGTRSETQVNQLLREVLALVSKQLEHGNVEVNLELEPNLPTILAIPNNMHQVFLNLILNAVDAMPDGGRLTVCTQQAHVGWVGVTIGDTGRGIAPEQISKIYDPFFTTKELGTGLGLAISRGIVEAHNGQIEVESVLNEGTMFSLRFPTGRD